MLNCRFCINVPGLYDLIIRCGKNKCGFHLPKSYSFRQKGNYLTVSDAGRQSLQGIEQIGEGFGVSGCAFSRKAGRRLDQNVNVLNQIVGRIRCPVSLSQHPLDTEEEETAGVPKLKGKRKERMKWKPKAEIKREVFLIERLASAAVSARDSALQSVSHVLS